ncbi:hypothetical protein GGS23DRAFT_607144 [Durotheca rogersii]|uniref:uncharacterized protein n=1 Tax=Durotheca rogersii TaxID=419775 RepID=UPI00221F4804|nr:uncharacterized protein GGS23DRAFT_607144 [Durotheca rogersii]KAI5859903.1 hypothetical protein GGS23DRAFT_607144 [Durotheca rogersii]
MSDHPSPRAAMSRSRYASPPVPLDLDSAGWPISPAVPRILRLAADEDRRMNSLRRFDRDGPPPYVSSTESFFSESGFFPPPLGRTMPEELVAIMEPPLDDKELNVAAEYLCSALRPDNRYYSDAKSEDRRLRAHHRSATDIFKGVNGGHRTGVIVRHNVKRRWEKLGVWNPQWGFAGRGVQPADDFRKWAWQWLSDWVVDDEDRAYRHRFDAIISALRLRQNLRRGEYAPVAPHSHLGPDATPTQADAFLLSRPWFVFQMEVAEERERYQRLSQRDQRRYPYSPSDEVQKRWEERGHWRDAYNRTQEVTAWKWQHESPSPEPEDLGPIDHMKACPLDAAAAMQFTPSEVDDLETIELPESEQPEGFWAIKEDDQPPYFPGQIGNPVATLEAMDNRFAETEAMIKGQYEQQEKKALLEEHNAPEPEPKPLGPPPKRRRLRQHRPSDDVDEAHDRGGQSLPPPARRSARIAGMKRPAEPQPLPAAPNKRPRPRPRGSAAPAAHPASRGARRAATSSGPAPAPLEREGETRPRLRSGRPGDGPGAAGVGKKKNKKKTRGAISPYSSLGVAWTSLAASVC